MFHFWLRTWQLGVKSLLLHPLRSLLTVLGIFIGVASVIWLLAFPEGISRKIQEQIEELGAENIIVESRKPASDEEEEKSRILQYGLLREDFDRLQNTIPTIEKILPIREFPCQFRYGDREERDGRLVGCTPDYAEMMQFEIDRGRFISDSDVKDRRNVCTLSAEVAQKVFGIEDPIGKSIHVEKDYYVVVGILKPRGATATVGGTLTQEFDKDVYVPIDTIWARIGDRIITFRSGSFDLKEIELSRLVIRVCSIDRVIETAEIVKATLARNHRKKDYRVAVPLEVLERAKTVRLMFFALMGVIAAISLLVGGIGIMNIMLATVTERTREIGIRRALGAKRRDIIRQFLVETIALSVVGGVTGIVVGYVTCGPFVRLIRAAFTKAIPEVMSQLPEVITTFEPVIVPWSIPLAFGISVTIGIVAGLYPAMRAAAMDPIEALRHE